MNSQQPRRDAATGLIQLTPREWLLRSHAEFLQLSDPHHFVGDALNRRRELATFAGAETSKYLAKLGGLLAAW